MKCFYAGVFAFMQLLHVQIHAQCYSNRYLSEIFTSTRTYENVLYNKPLQLQGACLIESNTDTAEYFLDVYEPDNDTLQKRPVIVYAHGGAFLIGDRRMEPIEEFCYRMAKRGFVVVSIDYRKCFNVLSPDGAIRAVYRSVQDMKAAIRFVKNNAATYKIDTNMVFAGGNSAGSIMAIHAAYADESERTSLPATYNNPDLGCLECSGNNFIAEGKPKALLNFWGAIVDTTLIRNNNVPMLSVHGMADVLVFPDLATPFSYPAFPPLYGSEPMVQQLNRLGIESEFHFIPGVGHEPWLFNCPCYVDSITDWAGSFLHRVMLQPKTPQVNFNSTICENDTIVFTVTNANTASKYCWNIQGGNVVEANTNESEIKIYFSSPTAASIAVNEKNIYDAISEIKTYNFNVNEKPIADAGNDLSICKGDTASLEAIGGNTFEWVNLNWMRNINSRNPIVFPPADEVYVLKTENSFCSNYDTMIVQVKNLPSAITKGRLNICKGDTAQINAFGTGNVSWQPTTFLSNSNNDTTTAFPLSTSQYILIAEESNCFAKDTLTVQVNDYPAIPEIIQSDNFLTTVSGFQYQWYRNDSLIDNSNFNILPLIQNAIYRVGITNAFGCTTFSESFFYELPSGIIESSNALFEVIPNPSLGNFKIEMVEAQPSVIMITDAQGKNILQSKVQEKIVHFNANNFAKGIYFIKIINQEKYFIQKLIIQ